MEEEDGGMEEEEDDDDDDDGEELIAQEMECSDRGWCFDSQSLCDHSYQGFFSRIGRRRQ